MSENLSYTTKKMLIIGTIIIAIKSKGTMQLET